MIKLLVLILIPLAVVFVIVRVARMAWNTPTARNKKADELTQTETNLTDAVAAERAELTKVLEQLTTRLAEGKITEATYTQLRSEVEGKLRIAGGRNS